MYDFIVCENDELCPGNSLCYTQEPYYKKCVQVQKQPDETRSKCLLPSKCDVKKGFTHCVTHPKIKSEEFGRCAKVTPVLNKHSGLDYFADTDAQPLPNMDNGLNVQPMHSMATGLNVVDWPNVQPVPGMGYGPNVQPIPSMGYGPIHSINKGLNVQPVPSMSTGLSMDDGPNLQPIPGMDYGLNIQLLHRNVPIMDQGYNPSIGNLQPLAGTDYGPMVNPLPSKNNNYKTSFSEKSQQPVQQDQMDE